MVSEQKKDGTTLLNVQKQWADSEYGKPYSKKKVNLNHMNIILCLTPPLISEKLMSEDLTCTLGFAGHRVRDPPDPIPNSEVKPCSVPGCSVVFGHANPGKLAALSNLSYDLEGNYSKLITKHL